MNNKKTDKYDDMIYMDRPISTKHNKMSIIDRAAQFAPFAALTGHDDAVKDTAKIISEKMEQGENILWEEIEAP